MVTNVPFYIFLVLEFFLACVHDILLVDYINNKNWIKFKV